MRAPGGNGGHQHRAGRGLDGHRTTDAGARGAGQETGGLGPRGRTGAMAARHGLGRVREW